MLFRSQADALVHGVVDAVVRFGEDAGVRADYSNMFEGVIGGGAVDDEMFDRGRLRIDAFQAVIDGG